MDRVKLIDFVLHCAKILLILLLLATLVFFSYRLVEGRLEDLAHQGDDGYHSGMGLYIFASHVVMLGIHAVLCILGLICRLIAQACRATPRRDKHVLAFRWLTLAPLLNQLAYVIVTVIVLNIT